MIPATTTPVTEPPTPIIPEHLAVLPRRGEAEFLAVRTTGIGGTDVSKILGLSRFGSPFSVYAGKIGLVPPQPAGEKADAGSFLEPWVLGRWAARTGKALWTPKATFRVIDRPWELMSPDGITLDSETIVDAKTRSPFDRKAWGEDGSPNVPAEERIQLEWYCALWKAPKWELAVSFDRSVEIFRADADPDVGQMLRDEAEAFWREHIVGRIPPTPMTGDAAAEFLRLRFPKNESTMRDAVVYEGDLARRWKRIADAIVAADEQKEALENEIKLCIADADGIRGPGWSFTWKKSKDSEYLNAGAVLREIEDNLGLLPPDARRIVTVLIAELKMKHGEVRPGSRRFLPARNFEIV